MSTGIKENEKRTEKFPSFFFARLHGYFQGLTFRFHFLFHIDADYLQTKTIFHGKDYQDDLGKTEEAMRVSQTDTGTQIAAQGLSDDVWIGTFNFTQQTT